MFARAAAVACLTVAIGLAPRAAEAVWNRLAPDVARLLAGAKDYAAALGTCQNWDRKQPERLSHCTIGAHDRPEFDFVLWGDSHVRSWAPVFAQIAQERHLRLVKFSLPGCAPLLQVRRTDVLEEGCAPELAADVMASIERLKPSQVVLISNWIFTI